MPLTLGTSDKTRAKNTHKLVEAGYSPERAKQLARAAQDKAQATKAAQPDRK